MWVIATNNLATFLSKYGSDTKLSATSDINKAFHFQSKKEASSYIHNQLPKSVRDKYVVVTEEDVISARAKAAEFEYINLRSGNVIESFRAVGQIIDHLPEYTKMLEMKRQYVEDALVDIYHYIEFNDLGTVAAYKIYKQEQDLLRQRRQLKEEQYCVEQLTLFLESDKSKLMKYVHILENVKDRSYIPKVLTELFDSDMS